MPTPVTSSTPYCTAAQLLTLLDWRLVADWVSDRGSRPSRASLLDPTDRAGQTVAGLLLAASGDLESNCLRGGMYTPADLQSLTGAAAADLQAMVAGAIVLRMAGRRQPVAGKMEDIPLAKWTQEKLNALRLGEKVFGLEAQIEAGSGMEAIEFVPRNETNTTRTVNYAGRYFGDRSRSSGGC